MKHLIFIFVIGLIFLPGVVSGFTVSQVVNHQAPEVYFYPQEFDKLVLDSTIPSGVSGQEDFLKAITLQNTGSAIDIREIDKIKLWKDEGKTGFQGMGVDEELGDFTFYSQNNSWYLNNLNQAIPITGLRIFISLEIYYGAVNNKTFQMKIPLLSDQNQSGNFDLGDLGIFLESENNGPTDGNILNSYRQTTYAAIIDSLVPKSVITDPEDGSEITTENYKILGMARDQGGSTPQWVKLSINDVWYEVLPTSSNYLTWEYNWQNIAEGTYILKTQSADWLGNVETVEEGITVTIAFPSAEEEEEVEEPVEEEEEIEEEEVEEEVEEEKLISEMTIEELKAEIAEIQQRIIDFLTQLIQLIQYQITQL